MRLTVPGTAVRRVLSGSCILYEGLAIFVFFML